MDMTESIAPRSDQINADDLMSGPVTVTIKEVTAGAAEQPFDFHMAEFPGRAYRPSKSMRRVIVMAWGKETTAYTGRRLMIYRNPKITFGRDEVGGIEISHLSHLEKPLTIALTATRGKRKPFTVQPLPDATTAAPTPDLTPILAAIHTAPGLTELQAAWGAAGKAGVQGHPDVIAAKDARKGELSA